MARLNLTCACGWNFFLPGTTTGHEVSCPNCGQAVRIPGRKPGQDLPTTAGAIAAEHARRQNIVRLTVGAGIVVIIAGIVFALIPGSKPPPEPDPGHRSPIAAPSRPPAPPPPKPPPSNPRPEPPPPLYTNAQIEEFKTTVLDKVRLINLTTIFAEIVRYRDSQNEAYAKFQADIAAHEAVIQECQANLAKVQQALDLPLYCAKGDKIINFNGQDLRAMYPGAAAQHMHNWALTWRAAEAVVQVLQVERAGKEPYITFNLTEESMDLRTLLRHPALAAEVVNGVASDRAAVSPDLIQRYQATLQALPAGYPNLLPSVDTLRITRLLQSKSASAEDAEWFKNRVLGDLLTALDADHKLIRKKLADLEPLVKENPAPDAVILKDKRRIDCKIIPEGGNLRLKLRGGSMLVTPEEIQEPLYGKGIGTEAATRMEASKGSVEKLMATMSWCGSKTLNNEKQYAACQVLLLEPSNDAARTAAGIPRPAFSAPKPK